MSQPCGWCGGAGEVTDISNFLLARTKLRRDPSWIGSSSDAMVVAAIEGHDEPSDRPFDGWDLGRCMVTRAVAPASLHPMMDKMIRRWVRKMNKDQRDGRGPYYGVKDARDMLAREEPKVRERIAEAVASTAKGER